MAEASAEEFKRIIESQHSGTATYFQSVRVTTPKPGSADWNGIVHVFDLKDHPQAKRVYAWSTPILGSTKPRFFAVLHTGRVTGPVEAVKAAVGAIRKWGEKGSA